MFACSCSTGASFSSGGSGGAPGAVTSVFGRIGAVVAGVGDYAASEVTNDSAVPGATVDLALNALGAGVAAVAASVAALTTDDVANSSGVAGATCSAALDALATATAAVAADLAALDSDGVANVSTVSGATVSDALDDLEGQIAVVIPPPKPAAAALPNGGGTISRTNGSRFVLPAGTLTGNSVFPIDRNGLPTTTPGTLSTIVIDVLDVTAFSKTFQNGGPGGTGGYYSIVVPAGYTRTRLIFQDDGTDWWYLTQYELP